MVTETEGRGEWKSKEKVGICQQHLGGLSFQNPTGFKRKGKFGLLKGSHTEGEKREEKKRRDLVSGRNATRRKGRGGKESHIRERKRSITTRD